LNWAFEFPRASSDDCDIIAQGTVVVSATVAGFGTIPNRS